VPLMLLVATAAVGASYVRGGRLERFSVDGLHGTPLLTAGLGFQLGLHLGAEQGSLHGVTGGIVLVASQVLVLAWLWHHRHLPGMTALLAGVTLNAIAITLNGAMPVAPDAIAAVGYPGFDPSPGKHELITAATAVPWLGDTIPVRSFGTIVSVGDLLLALGLFPLAHHLLCRLPERPEPPFFEPDDEPDHEPDHEPTVASSTSVPTSVA